MTMNRPPIKAAKKSNPAPEPVAERFPEALQAREAEFSQRAKQAANAIRIAKREMEQVASDWLDDLDSRTTIHLDDLLEIASRTSHDATLEAVRTFGGYVMGMHANLRALLAVSICKRDNPDA